MQEEIIRAALNGNDTLALLPTGGGKSVCFQVPAMLLEGVCIVVTPLIALMKDQVEQLRNKDILAVAVHSGMTRREIDISLDNAVYGKLKFLYVSPERLQTEIFVERVKQMKVALIAVDEAHCISQWGYDFRPPYLQIASLRELKPDVPIIALTASATQQVQDDIVEKLEFRKPFLVYKKSFARPNLSFVIRKSENKEKKVLEILAKVKGTAIIYVRSRKATQEISKFLTKRGITASFYHAGLTFEDRTKRQDEWISNEKRVMVATNAFGMGIDKPDVRLVIHLDLPENLEAYYQEAGRAGRDGKRSYAAILYQEVDISNVETKVMQQFPSLAYLKQIYQALANFYQLAEGSAAGESFDFDLHEFAERFNFSPVEAYNALKKLEEEGLLQLNESFYSPSTLHFLKDHHSLYQFQVANAKFDEPIKMMMRLYGGELFSGFVKISESYLAKTIGLPLDQTVALLKHLHEMKIVLYTAAKDKPQITFLLPRQDAAHLPVDLQRMKERQELIESKMRAIVNYVKNDHRCRMQFIQDYFNEVSLDECGICDVCVGKRKKDNHNAYALLRKEILHVLKSGSMAIEQLEEHMAPKDSELFVDVVRELVDEGLIEYDHVWQLKLTSG